MIIPLIANASITRETLSIVIHTVVELQYFTFTLFLFKRCNVFKSEFYGTKCSCLMGSCPALFSFRHILNQLKKIEMHHLQFLSEVDLERNSEMQHRCYNEQVETFYFRFQSCSFRSRRLHTHICVWG